MACRGWLYGAGHFPPVFGRLGSPCPHQLEPPETTFSLLFPSFGRNQFSRPPIRMIVQEGIRSGAAVVFLWQCNAVHQLNSNHCRPLPLPKDLRWVVTAGKPAITGRLVVVTEIAVHSVPTNFRSKFSALSHSVFETNCTHPPLTFEVPGLRFLI